MTVDCSTVGDVSVIRLGGALDHGSADALRGGVYAGLRQQRRVLINLALVQWIDAAGLGALAHVHRMAAVVGGRVTLTEVGFRVREMLDVAGLSACFEIAASECDAIEDFDLCVVNHLAQRIASMARPDQSMLSGSVGREVYQDSSSCCALTRVAGSDATRV
jgi:anti-anti-sigma factor